MFRKIRVYAAVFIMVMTMIQGAGGLEVIAENVTDDNYVIVRYLHGNFRCASCLKIEKYTQEAIDDNFSKELQNGQLRYKVVNVEKKENVHFVEDYELYTKSVVVALVGGGKEVKYKNLEKVWEYLGDKNKFCNYITVETMDFLNKLPGKE